MKKRNSNPENSTGLRRMAEEQMRSGESEINQNMSETDMLKLIHELKVYQIEVEMQNEELTLANETARAATEKYEELYDLAPSGYYTLSRDGSILEMNLRGAQMLGKERTLLLNSRFGFFIKEDSRGVFADFLDEVFQGKRDVNCDLPLFPKGDISLHVHLTGIMSDTKEQCRVTAIDITELKNAEDDLRKNLAKYKVLIDTFPIAITISDPAGKIIETNEKALELLGLSREEHLKRKLKGEEWTIIKPDGTIFPQDEYASVKALKENRLVENVEMGIVKAGEEITWLNVTAAPIPIEDHGVLIAYNDITERKHNLEKLIKNEERYALIIEASEQGIWDWNVETNEVFYSEQWKKQIGYNDNELKNEFNTWVEHLHPDEKEYCQNAVISYLNHPVEHFILDFRFRHKDGSYRWIHNKAASIKNKEGKVIRLFGTHTDFTESKLSEAIFKEIIEKNPMSIQILDMEGYPIQVNPAHTKLFGVEPPTDYSVFKDNQLLSLGFDKLFDRIKKGEVVFFPDSYYNVLDVDPSFPDSPAWVKALGFTLNDNNGNPSKIVLMHENITERKNAEALLNDIIENNPMSIQIVDKEGHTLRGNPAFVQLFGSVPPPEFSIFEDLQSKSAELANLVSRVKNGEIVHLPDVYFNAHDAFAEAPDIPLWIRAMIFPLKNSAGKPERFVFMHENITERKLYEAEIHKFNEELEQRVTDRTAQLETANKELEAFSYSVSHDLRTPLRALNGFATILTEDYSIVLDDEGKRLLAVISENATKMGYLIDDLLSFSRLGRIEMLPLVINMKTMAATVYKDLVPETDKDKIRFTLGNIPPALGDSSMIKQVWVNLIGNAIKFTSKKTDRNIEIGFIAGENENIYYVKDNGAGFEMAHATKLFGVFQRLHSLKDFDGIGAGLAIVRRIVLRHNGRVWAEGKVNEGATFYFTLPLNK
jgi:PAS domain S-box-containing protein